MQPWFLLCAGLCAAVCAFLLQRREKRNKETQQQNRLALLEQEKTALLTAYEAALPESPADAVVCRNQLVRAVLSIKTALCRREGICLEVGLELLPEVLPLTDGELCAVFSVLLDSGVRAVAELPPGKRSITLKSSLQGNLLTVMLRHPIAVCLCSQEDAGLELLRELARAYQGEVITLVQEERYTVIFSALFPVEQRI